VIFFVLDWIGHAPVERHHPRRERRHIPAAKHVHSGATSKNPIIGI
jgi:hypothetical protein